MNILNDPGVSWVIALYEMICKGNIKHNIYVTSRWPSRSTYHKHHPSLHSQPIFFAMINHYCPAGTSYHLKKMDGLVAKEYENTLKYALAHCQAKTSPAATSCVKMYVFAPCSDKVWYTIGFLWSSTGCGVYQLWLYGKDQCWVNNRRIFIFDYYPLWDELKK